MPKSKIPLHHQCHYIVGILLVRLAIKLLCYLNLHLIFFLDCSLPRAMWHRRTRFLRTPCFYRTVLLRLASLGVLMIKIYAKVDETCEDNPETCCQQVRSLCAFDQIVVVVAVINITKGLLVSAVKYKGQTLSFLSLCSYLMLGQLIISLSIYISCFLNFFQNWENEIASQMYMLIWLDFFSHIFSSLVVTSVRK